jgi:hypothetical protein
VSVFSRLLPSDAITPLLAQFRPLREMIVFFRLTVLKLPLLMAPPAGALLDAMVVFVIVVVLPGDVLSRL